MIVMPPDGRQIYGKRIEGLVYQLDELVTEYLNMLSIDDRPNGKAKVRETVAARSVLAQVLGLTHDERPRPGPP